MIQQHVYLDTSVPSALVDESAPDRQLLTQWFWDQTLHQFHSVVSDLVLTEIRLTPDDQRRRRMMALVEGMDTLSIDEEAQTLARDYVSRGVFGPRHRNDAIHVAVATVAGVRNLVSWNFRHLVRVQTRREINLMNALKGYMPIEIVAPPEL